MMSLCLCMEMFILVVLHKNVCVHSHKICLKWLQKEVTSTRIVIPTSGIKGLEDTVSEVFGRSKFFTLIQIIDGSVTEVEVLENPAYTYKHGVGPIVVKTLADKGVTAVAAREFGPGVAALLEQQGIKMFKVKAHLPVREAINIVLRE